MHGLIAQSRYGPRSLRVTLHGVDWHPGEIITLVSVVSTAVVGMSGKVTDVITKRGDRKYESAQKLDDRVWETKSAALTTVIDVCLDISEKCDLEPARPATVDSDGIDVPAVDPIRSRRLKVVRALVGADELLDQTVVGTVASFCAKAVRRELHRLISTIKTEMKKHANELAEIRRNSESVDNIIQRLAESDVATASEHPLWNTLGTYLDRSSLCEDRIATECDLDFDSLKKTCESVVEEARKDLGASG